MEIFGLVSATSSHMCAQMAECVTVAGSSGRSRGVATHVPQLTHPSTSTASFLEQMHALMPSDL